MMSIKSIIISIFLVDLLVGVFAFFYGGYSWFLNSQIAFISSFIITMFSFNSYKNLINKRLESEVEKSRDEIDNIEDRFDLYDEEIKEDENIDLKSFIKENRAKVGGVKSSFTNLSKSLSGVFNPFRLLAYLFLFLSFLYLVNNHYFNLYPYFLGLSVVPVGVLLGALYKGE